jgi:hypothetical protein
VFKNVRSVLYIGSDEEDQLLFCHAIDEIAQDIECIMAQSCAHARLLLENQAVPEYIFIDAYMTMVWNPECLTGIINDARLAEVKWINYTAQKTPQRPEHAQILQRFIRIPKPTATVDVAESLETLFK